MRRLITLLFLVFIALVSQGQVKYPIKTIYKGDSVVILTIQQSNKINELLEKSSRDNKQVFKKNQEYEERIQRLEIISREQNMYIDSLSNALLQCWLENEQIQYVSDTLLKQYEELNLTIYEMSVGPTLLYTLPPYKEVLFLNLKHFNMYMDSDGSLVLVRMTPKEIEKYDEWRKKYGDESLMYVDYHKVIRFKDFQDELVRQVIWKNKRAYENK